MKDEVYTVLIRGGTLFGDYRLSGTGADGLYRVDWTTVLPRKYRKFKLTAYFRDAPDVDYNLADHSILYVECGAFNKPFFYDNKTASRSPVIAIAPVCAHTSTSPYHETAPGGMPITVHYPTENTFPICITQQYGASIDPVCLAQWVLVLSFTPLTDAVC